MITLDKPHLKLLWRDWSLSPIWHCCMLGLPGLGYGYTPKEAYADWDEWIHRKQTGYYFMERDIRTTDKGQICA